MVGKRNGLGKGLDSLIPNKTVKEESASQQKVSKEKQEKNVGSGEILVKINEVEPNREQPRKEFDEDSLMELADSIRQFGILQPLLVQKKKDYYEIIAGERRWRAAKLAGIKDVPIIVKNYTDQEIVEISLIENIQRENLNPIEEAMAYKRLLEEFDLKQDEVAERVSKSRTAVTNSMRLLKLSERVQQMIVDDMISTGHARALLALDDEEQQYILANKIFDEKLNYGTKKTFKETLHSLGGILIIGFAIVFSFLFVPEVSYRQIQSSAEADISEITKDNAFILKTETDYHVYVDGKYFATIHSIPKELKNIPLYMKGDYHEKE